MVWVDDDRRILVVVDRDRSAIHFRFGIEASPGALRHRDSAQLRAGRPVGRHMAGSHPTVVAGGLDIAERFAPVARLLAIRHAAISFFSYLLRLGPIGDCAHQHDIFGNAAVEE